MHVPYMLVHRAFIQGEFIVITCTLQYTDIIVTYNNNILF